MTLNHRVLYINMDDQTKSSITQEQIILARSRLWTPELEKLLRRWRKQIDKREKGHTDQARSLGRYHYILGIPSLVLNSSAIGGVVATFQDCTDGTCPNIKYARLSFAAISATGTVLMAIITFMNFQDRGSEHKSYANEYGELGRTIESMLLIPGTVRGDPVMALQSIKNEYDGINRRAPTLPSQYDDVDLTYEVVSDEVLLTPPKPGQIKIPMRRTLDRRKSAEDDKNALKSMLDETEDFSESSEKVDYEIEMIEKTMAEQNDYDTSDEEHEVCIAFDIYKMPPKTEELGSTISMLSARREKQVQTSYQKALNFEIGRLKRNNSANPDGPVPKLRQISTPVNGSEKKTVTIRKSNSENTLKNKHKN